MIAETFMQNNASKVFICSRKAAVCEASCAKLNGLGKGTAYSIPGDLQSRTDITRIVARVTEVLGPDAGLDVLVNNSGNNWAAPIDEYPDAAWDRVLGLNLKAAFVMTQACLPLLDRAASEASPARVIHIGSVDGNRVPVHETFAYSASKAGLQMLSRSLAAHLGPRLITSNVIACGPFQSHMMKETLEHAGDAIRAGIPLGRIGRASDVGGVCVFLSSCAGSYVNGAVVPCEGGHLSSNGRFYESPNL